FWIGNLFNKDAYKPLPMGEGQTLYLRLQGSTYFQTYSLSFRDPWLGRKKPIQFSGSISYSKQYDFDWSRREANRDRSFNIMSVYLGIAKRLSVPDDYFYLQEGIGYQHYDLKNYNTGLFTFGNGSASNPYYT